MYRDSCKVRVQHACGGKDRVDISSIIQPGVKCRKPKRLTCTSGQPPSSVSLPLPSAFASVKRGTGNAQHQLSLFYFSTKASFQFSVLLL